MEKKKIRELCNPVLLQLVLSHISSLQAITTTRESPRTDAENKDLYDLALQGLQLLSAWTQQVMELVRNNL